MDIFAHKYLLAEKIIKNSIRNLEVGTKLDGERTIAEELGISYMTARKAVENLVDDGVLYKIPRKGTYVASRKAIAGEPGESEDTAWVYSHRSAS